jgi:hypothetical protein
MGRVGVLENSDPQAHTEEGEIFTEIIEEIII